MLGSNVGPNNTRANSKTRIWQGSRSQDEGASNGDLGFFFIHSSYSDTFLQQSSTSSHVILPGPGLESFHPPPRLAFPRVSLEAFFWNSSTLTPSIISYATSISISTPLKCFIKCPSSGEIRGQTCLSSDSASSCNWCSSSLICISLVSSVTSRASYPSCISRGGSYISSPSSLVVSGASHPSSVALEFPAPFPQLVLFIGTASAPFCIL